MYISRTHLFPVPLGLDTVLIPVKVRKTIGVNDGAYAYIDLSFIDNISREKNVTIRLKSGYVVTCLENLKTINERIDRGIVIREKFTSTMFGELNLMEGISKIGAEYQKPATKGDMTILAYEIMKLRKSFEKYGGEKMKKKKVKVSKDSLKRGVFPVHTYVIVLCTVLG